MMRRGVTYPRRHKYWKYIQTTRCTTHVSAETLQTPRKNARGITDHHVLHMFGKCRMLNLTFLRDSYVTWERRRFEIKFQAFGGLLGTFGGHFGSILGTFSAHFGGPERTWKHTAYKREGYYFYLATLGPKHDEN